MTSIEEVLKNRLLFTIKRRCIWEFLDGERYINYFNSINYKKYMGVS